MGTLVVSYDPGRGATGPANSTIFTMLTVRAASPRVVTHDYSVRSQRPFALCLPTHLGEPSTFTTT
jgi:hypothetical protein